MVAAVEATVNRQFNKIYLMKTAFLMSINDYWYIGLDFLGL